MATERGDSGVYIIAKRDVKLIGRRPPGDENRRAVMLRRTLERYAAWARAAGVQPVSTSLASSRMRRPSGWHKACSQRYRSGCRAHHAAAPAPVRMKRV